MLSRALMLGLIVASASSSHAGPVRLRRPATGTALVRDPAAPGGLAVAVRIHVEPGAVTMGLQWADAGPGLYRVALPIHLHTPPGFKAALLKMNVAFNDGESAWLTYPVAPAQLDGGAGAWTVLRRPVVLNDPSPPNAMAISWSFAPAASGRKGETAFKIETPDVPALEVTEGDGLEPAAAGLLDEIANDTPVPLSKIDYPAIVVADPVFEPVTTTLAVTRVWPAKVHVYPGEPNPIEVTVKNFTDRPADGVVRLEIRTGLDEIVPVGKEQVRVPARGSAKLKFPWQAGRREYGHAAIATVSVDGAPVHSGAEYFTVSAPIWKTAIQGSGFITWYGREQHFAQHVADNRRAYINVEEAFSWQPSSWTDLNPTNEAWWAGQNDFHNSMAGLREWMGRSHSNGIKMITYSWPAASGKPGYDFGRRFPDILCREKGGLPGTDNEDLALREITDSRPELWRYRSGQWLSNFINLGLLRAIDHHAREVIRSSRNFGWDGVRFDFPPGWSAMGTADVHREFEMLGVTNLMQHLVPEYYEMTNAVWSGQAISARNVRYFRHVFTEQLGTNFALSYNAGGLGPVTDAKAWWRAEMCRDGGQLMNEAIRTVGSMSNYMDVAWWHAEAIRKAGGYSCVFMAERCPAPLARVYSAIFTFASGTHPYGNYGWLGPMPGEYTKFMTRYGEWCWDPALAPVDADRAGVAVESKAPLLWKRHVRQRQTGDELQTVVHLITSPAWAPEEAAAQTQAAWRRDVTVRKECRSEPEVWRLTAEPELTAIRLQVEQHDAAYSVTVPEVRFWALIVWRVKR